MSTTNDRSRSMGLLRQMKLIRHFEERAAEM